MYYSAKTTFFDDKSADFAKQMLYMFTDQKNPDLRGFFGI